MTRRERRLATAAAALALIWGGTTFGLRPLLAARRTTAEAIEQARFDLAQARNTLLRGEGIERQLASARADGNRLRGRLLPGDDVNIAGAELGKIVNRLWTQVDAELQGSSERDPIASGDLTAIPVEIHLELTIEKLTDLLYRIETHQHELRVSKIVVRQKNQRSPDEKLDVRMTINGYAASAEGEDQS